MAQNNTEYGFSIKLEHVKFISIYPFFLSQQPKRKYEQNYKQSNNSEKNQNYC